MVDWGESLSIGTSFTMSALTISKPSAERCIAALVAANGNVRLAAERLNVSEADLKTIISEDPANIEILGQQIRVHTMLQTFELAGKSLYLLAGTLDKLDTYDLSKHSMNLLNMIEKFTNSQTTTQNINVNNELLKALPPEIREAVKEFIDK